MKFRNRTKETPEVNLIPFIDVLLVIIIFLMLTTSYARISTLQIRLPDANAQEQDTVLRQIDVEITSNGIFAINGVIVQEPSVATIAQQLILVAQAENDKDRLTIVINADSLSNFQSIVTVMDAAKQAGLPRLTIATQTPRE